MPFRDIHLSDKTSHAKDQATRSENPSGKDQKRLDPRSNDGYSAGQSRPGEQYTRSRSPFAGTGDRLVNGEEQRKNVFEEQRYKQQKELEGVAKVDYSDPDVPKLRGGMEQGDKKKTKDFLTEEEMENYNSGNKKPRFDRTSKEHVAMEIYGIARGKPNYTDAHIQERIDDIRKGQRYKEAFGEGSSSQQPEATSSGLENEQHDSSEQPGQKSCDTRRWDEWQREEYGSDSWDHSLYPKDWWSR